MPADNLPIGSTRLTRNKNSIWEYYPGLAYISAGHKEPIETYSEDKQCLFNVDHTAYFKPKRTNI